MPPYSTKQAVQQSCIICEGDFPTKRPETAKYCSTRCKERGRHRAYDAAATARRYESRMADPRKRAAYNLVARRRARTIKDWLNKYKLQRGCVDCGYRKHPAALDIDHMEGKSANVSQLKSIGAIKAEIQRHKCVVRCANCHRIKSFETKTWLAAHPQVDDSPALSPAPADRFVCGTCGRDFRPTKNGRVRYHVDVRRRAASGWAPPCAGSGLHPSPPIDEAVLAETYEPVNADA